MATNGRRERFLLHLAAGQTAKRAAELAGISQRTGTRYLADPDFRQRLADLQTQHLETTMRRLNSDQRRAAAKLRRLLKASNEAVALGAAKAILESAASLRAAVSVEDRLRRLEQEQAARKPFRGGFRA
jgi:hypothetical protein